MRRPAALLLSLALALFGLPALDLGAQATTGEVLAVVGRQVARVSVAGLRPRQVSSFAQPANAVDVTALPGGSTAIVAVTSPNADGRHGGDLHALDLAGGGSWMLVGREHGGESLLAPAWLPDGRGVVFQREDLQGALIAPPGHEVAHYPSRIEEVAADGSGRTVLVADGHNPGPSPDGTGLVFARSTNRGSSLHLFSRADWTEQTLVPVGPFNDVGSPRFSPAGDVVAFGAPRAGAARAPDPLGLVLRTPSVLAHGFPWSVWAVNADGTGLRLLAELTADEPSLSWSPDGTRLFVYGFTGSFVVDAATGASKSYPRLLGGGTTSWIVD